MATLARLGFAALLGITGCGDPQYDNSYRGESIFQYKGQTTPAGTGIEGAQNVRVAVFYSPSGVNVVDPTQLVEHLAASMPIVVAESFELNVFEPPGIEHMLKSADGASAGYALGRILVYQDTDKDGRYTAGEPILGGEQPKINLYVPSLIPVEHSPGVSALPAGFLKVVLPQPCGFVPAPATDSADCGVPLGGRCRSDAECGVGTCLIQAKESWKAGYCIVPDPPKNGCRPGAAAYLRAIKASPGPENVDGYYLRPCTQNTDCFRPGDPENNLYTCDIGIRGCVPTPPQYLPLPIGGTQAPTVPFCVNGS